MSLSQEKAIFCWSGGKDSALSLYKVLQQKRYQVVSLLTTLNRNYRRISMHGIREELLDKQIKAIGIPLVKVYVEEGTNDEYEKKMEDTLLAFKKQGVNNVIFGDIFLEELRQYRDNNLTKVKMKGIYPLWKQNTKSLIYEFINSGFKTITCCVSDEFFSEEHVGKIIDKQFIARLPTHVDACGENGEYHSFVFDGPVFSEPINYILGEKIYRSFEIKKQDSNSFSQKGFWYVDLQPIG